MNMSPSNPVRKSAITITLHLPLAEIVEATDSQNVYTVILPDNPDMIPQKELFEEGEAV